MAAPLLLVSSLEGSSFGRQIVGQLAHEFVAEVTSVSGDQVTLMVGRQTLQATTNLPLQQGQQIALRASGSSDGTVQLQLIERGAQNQSTSVASPPPALPDESLAPDLLPARLPGQLLQAQLPPGLQTSLAAAVAADSEVAISAEETPTVTATAAAEASDDGQAAVSAESLPTISPATYLQSTQESAPVILPPLRQQPTQLTFSTAALSDALDLPLEEAVKPYPLTVTVLSTEEGKAVLSLNGQQIEATTTAPLSSGEQLTVMVKGAADGTVTVEELPQGTASPMAKQALSETIIRSLSPEIGGDAAAQVASAIAARGSAERDLVVTAARFLASLDSPSTLLRTAVSGSPQASNLLRQVEGQATSGEGAELNKALSTLGIDQEKRLLDGSFSGQTLKSAGGAEAERVVGAQQLLAARPNDPSQLAASLFFLPLPGGEARFTVEGNTESYPATPTRVKGELQLSGLGEMGFDIVAMQQGIFIIVGSDQPQAKSLLQSAAPELEEAVSALTGKPVVLTISGRDQTQTATLTRPPRSDRYA